METRMKYTLHPGTLQATLKVDGVEISSRVIQDSVPCPDTVDAAKGLSCLDVKLPDSGPPHNFKIDLIESGPMGLTTSTIQVPSSAQTGSRWHPLYAPVFSLIVVAMVVSGLGFAAIRERSGNLRGKLHDGRQRKNK